MRILFGWTSSEIVYTMINEVFAEKLFILISDDNRDSIFVADINDAYATIENIITEINAILEVELCTRVTLSKVDNGVLDELSDRIQRVKKLYLEEKGGWTQSFIDKLGDDMSKVSFRSFLKQRIQAHIMANSPCILPINPPEETKEWREEKCANPPQFPIIEHCSQFSIQSAQYCCFTVEQYGVEGIVSAKEGDNVIDAGAHIGDTALYFSQKVGATGKVYAFEPFEQTAEYARDNAKQNAYTNIEVIAKAITKDSKNIRFSVNDIVASGSKECEDGDLVVPSISIDDFAKERNICVNYIKADVEGGELALLLGAEKTIKKDKPICGICIYHKQEDYYEIPQLLEKFCPEYTFYFRSEAEPVVFAVVE